MGPATIVKSFCGKEKDAGKLDVLFIYKRILRENESHLGLSLKERIGREKNKGGGKWRHILQPRGRRERVEKEKTSVVVGG